MMIGLAAILAVTTVNVTGLGMDGSLNRNLIQAELNKAVTMSERLKVCIPKGTYPLSATLFIYSNTELSLSSDTVFTRNGSDQHNMLFVRHRCANGELCAGDSSCTHGGYSQFSNIQVSGGTWDAAGGKVDDGGIFHLCHGSDIVISNAKFLHASGHMLNLSGSRNIRIENCTFQDAVRYEGTDAAFWGNYDIGDEEAYKTVECIHLDVMNEEGESGNYPMDDTPCANVSVSKCKFIDVFSAVGSHHYYPGIWLKGLAVKDCSFMDLLGPAVYSMGVTNCIVEGCTASYTESIAYASYSYGVLKNNEIKNSRRDGIFLYNQTDYELIGNTVDESVRNGINVYGSRVRINGNNVVKSGNCAVLVSSNSSALLADNELNGAATNGVCALSGTEIDVRRTTIDGCLKSGIAAAAAKQVRILGNTIRNGEIGVYLTSVGNGLVSDNQVDKSTMVGIAVSGGDAEIVSNVIADTYGIGIRIDKCSDATANGNLLTNVSATAIYVVGGNAYVEENTIVNSGEHGVLASGMAKISVVANAITRPKKTGIYLYSRSSGMVSGNNVMQPGEDGIMVYEAEESDFDGNIIIGSVRNGLNVYNSRINNSGNTVSQSGNCSVLISHQSKVKMNGDKLDGAGLHGIYAYDKSELNVSKTTITGYKEDGIVVDNSESAVLCDNYIGGGKIGLYFTAVTHGRAIRNELMDQSVFGIAASVGDVEFSSNVIKATKGFGLRLDTCAGVKVYGNLLEGIGATAVYIVGGSAEFRDNSIVEPAQHGIMASGGAQVILKNTVISKPEKTGIYLSGCGTSEIDANRIVNAGGKGVWLQDSSLIKVSANEIDHIEEEGVYCMCSSAIITYNSICNTGKSAIRIAGESGRLSSAQVLKNEVTCEAGSKWSDIWFEKFCEDSIARENITNDKGLKVDSSIADQVLVADTCLDEDEIYMDYYDIVFTADDGSRISRMLCRKNIVYKLPASGGKGWLSLADENGKRFDDEILIFNLARVGKSVVMMSIR